ncbi:hypothetical protein M4V62_23145 [Streptomyces durmitorensis]|uniref:Uncharacterized protein n=1 Tax=Streptomyces durmitorensis TaxID=319947 RepID=A0ABY4Q6W4_9ACTN|nr:hypothetical protein [Streptomyces durmitorensis]UQT61928.1 hypothetical protein M4V62_23145 [Streptomyces durmitorensis]
MESSTTPSTSSVLSTDALLARGYPHDAVAVILGGNFRRVAALVWR